MSVLSIVGIVLLALVGGFLILVLSKPSAFRYSRTATIKAPSQKIFPMINDFHSHESIVVSPSRAQ